MRKVSFGKENLSMKSKLLALPVAAALMLATVPAQAHHSFGATYDVSKEITIKGKIVQLSLRSPHSFFFIEAEDNTGTLQRWSIEGAAAGQFAQQGVTRDAFKVGDPVEVVANPARSATSYRGRLLKITRTTDGKSWGSKAGETFE
jgi:DNA/RNA endonuclease YhcR with UshA esterase domain